MSHSWLPGRAPKEERNPLFDGLRLLFALFVLLSHAVEITDGHPGRELLHRLTGSVTLGTLGVDGFFVMSGYLIVQSWLFDPLLTHFLRKRALRILPGYLVAVVASTVAVGVLAPGVDHFFQKLDVHFIHSIVMLGAPATPSVFPGRPYAMVNGAMYTIAYEVRCYLLVALLGACGLLRRPVVAVLATGLLLVWLCWPNTLAQTQWPRLAVVSLGLPMYAFRLTAVYLVGGCYGVFRSRIVYRRLWATAAALGAAGVIVFSPPRAEFALVLAGSYLMFFLADKARPHFVGIRRFPDISYGLYLYGWPVESLWIWFHHGLNGGSRWESPWIAFVASTLICVPLAWLSWHFVERPALSLKRRPSAALPPG